jgi:1-deoxy-D-xylulose-5-phosphate synthase
MTFPDIYIDQASPKDMYAQAALNADDIEAKVLEVLGVADLSRTMSAQKS